MVWSARLKTLLAAAAFVIAATAAVAVDAGPGDAGAALAILLVAALAVVQLTSRARAQVDQANERARQAEIRERESRLLAEAGASLLAGGPAAAPVLGPRMEHALAEAGARIQLCHAPAPRAGETALPLRMTGSSGWLYLDRNGPWTKQDAERTLQRISDLIELAQDRARSADTAAKAEAALRSDSERTAVMRAIAHDLRTPLTAISTATTGLSEPQIVDEDRLELTSVVTTEAGRLERMLDDLLDLSRIEAGAVNPRTDWCDLNETIASAAAQVRAQHGDFGIRVDLPAELPRISADAAQLQRAFTNLIDNAAKFSCSDKPVEIRGVSANGRVTIRVIDHGRVIAPSDHAHIFKPFVRGREAQTGSDLGLAICRGFVEANGGRITLQSRGRDGAAFAVSFPAAQQPSPVG
jgi:two-component system, OmpR family, sensor histidine kinase KdpD